MNAMSRKQLLHAWAATMGLAALVALPGCGRNRVTVDVDVASFLDQTDLTAHYTAPPFTQPVELDLDPVGINLVEGFGDFGAAEEVAIEIVVEYDNLSGHGDASLTLFFDDNASTVFSTPAVTSLEASLMPNQVTTSHARFQADARIIELFTAKQMFMGIRFNWTPEPGSTEALEGDYFITAIRAHVVSNVEIF